ncbi:MAG: HoxN/HupN/NixA family nickel/cobalt transporter [Acidimicrobiia bacterium]
MSDGASTGVGSDQVGPKPFRFDRHEGRRLVAMYGSAAALAIVAWVTFFHYQHHYGPAYAAGGSLAFGFGVRHAFDADHISAIDDTTRYLMQRGKKRLGVGYFFALGHSTIVIGLSVAIAIAAATVSKRIPQLEADGGNIGSLVSGTFLFAIAILDLFILTGLIDVWKKAKTGTYKQEELDDLMMQRGFINRIMGSRWRRFVSDSWQMYPVGVLFGLGFDTATQVGVLALTAGAASGHLGGKDLPWPAVIALPLLFTAGMTMMDLTDGVVMSQAYGWAFLSPFRKVYYNMATVALGVFVAMGVGTIEVFQVLSTTAHWHGRVWLDLNRLDFEKLGYLIVGSFVVLWVLAVLSYRFFHFEDKYGANLTVDPFASSVAVSDAGTAREQSKA